MAHGTEQVNSTGLTRSEQEVLIHLLKHPKIKELADEVRKKNKKEDEK